MSIPLGLCQCGCGERTEIAPQTVLRRGYVKGQPRQFVIGHNLRGSASPAYKDGRSVGTNYAKVAVGGAQWRDGHRAVAERVLGKPLPPMAEVHHVNRNRRDNRTANLVICEDHAYHSLLHQRADALRVCGNADWRRCSHCHRYDDRVNLYIRDDLGLSYHRACAAAYQRSRQQKRREASCA